MLGPDRTTMPLPRNHRRRKENMTFPPRPTAARSDVVAVGADTVQVVFARLRPNVADRQSRHSCHACPLPHNEENKPTELRTYCGMALPTAFTEWSLYPDGAPCLRCMIAAPVVINDVLGTARR